VSGVPAGSLYVLLGLDGSRRWDWSPSDGGVLFCLGLGSRLLGALAPGWWRGVIPIQVGTYRQGAGVGGGVSGGWECLEYWLVAVLIAWVVRRGLCVVLRRGAGLELVGVWWVGGLLVGLGRGGPGCPARGRWGGSWQWVGLGSLCYGVWGLVGCGLYGRLLAYLSPVLPHFLQLMPCPSSLLS
jgi:hypothetical protein